jgi:S-DNA-T family DNA segregation ATPase FtsK/SpoIIIE
MQAWTLPEIPALASVAEPGIGIFGFDCCARPSPFRHPRDWITTMNSQEPKASQGGIGVLPVLLILFALFTTVSLWTANKDDAEYLAGGLDRLAGCRNAFGYIGAQWSRFLFLLLGMGAWVVALETFLVSVRLFLTDEHERKRHLVYWLSLILMPIGISMFAGLYPASIMPDYLNLINLKDLPGGVIGQVLCEPGQGILFKGANEYGCLLVAVLISMASIYYLWHVDWEDPTVKAEPAPQPAPRPATTILQDPRLTARPVAPGFEPALSADPETAEAGSTGGWFSWLWKSTPADDAPADPSSTRPFLTRRRVNPDQPVDQEGNPLLLDLEANLNVSTPEPVVAPPAPRPVPAPAPVAPRKPAASGHYRLPALTLLKAAPGGKISSAEPQEIATNKGILQQTLDSFSIEAQVGDSISGPRITLYEILPAPGVKVERIAAIQNNFAMQLRAQSLRILTPIPGKNTVGIEVPNRIPANVLFHDIAVDPSWQNSRAQLPLLLGRGINGDVAIMDLAKAPHLLIAGATGTGKSVCINAVLMSLLYRFSPEELRLILVDPKVVEFTPYQKLPHLVTPVITDVNKVPLALRWVINEMEQRYHTLASAGCRNLESFNNREPVAGAIGTDGKPLPTRLPYIVVIIDELADIMMTAKADVETSLARIAQKSRAVGIHAIIATQRPSVNVLTGVIKANFPTRISFQVSSQVDARTILDNKGAESLLGMGDMLYRSSTSPNVERIQGAFVSEQEVQKVVDFIASQAPQLFDDTVFKAAAVPIADTLPGLDPEGAGGDDASLVDQAEEIILRDRKASISYIQRMLKVGYNKAATIMDELEARGIVGPQKSGVGQRDILVGGGGGARGDGGYDPWEDGAK